MNVAIVTKSFPSVSQTFIALQILELVKAGFNVTIISLTLPKGGETVSMAFTPEQFRKVNGQVRVYSTLYNEHDSYGAFLKKLIRVIIFSFKKSPSIFINCLPYLFKGRAGYKKIKDLLYDSEVLDNINDPDLIHCQFADLADRVVTANKVGLLKSSAPIVFSVRGYDITRQSVVENIDWKQLSNRCALALPVCSHFKELLVSLGWEDSKIHIVPSSINIEKAMEMQKDINSLKEIRIISVGRLTEKKGFDDAIEAIKLFDSYHTNYHYTIIGEGNLLKKFRNKIKEYDLESRISLLGKQPTDKTLQLIAQSDILIAPSKSAQDGDCEGIPNVLKEAMVLGLQVISTYHSGIPELVINKETGFLVNESSPNEITKALLEIVSDKTKWEERSKKAQEIVLDNYSPEIMLRKLVEAYHITLYSQQAFQNTTIKA